MHDTLIGHYENVSGCLVPLVPGGISDGAR